MKKNVNKYGQEQLELKLDGRKLDLSARNVGTPDHHVGDMLRESLKMVRLRQNDPKSCFCYVNAKLDRKRHNAKKCRCVCHKKTKARSARSR